MRNMTPGLRRLLTLANALDKPLPRGMRFDLTHWFKKNHCGTVGCAMGVACTIPSFQRLGLKLDSCYSQPDYQGYSGVQAAERFFEIDYYDAHSLFMPDDYPYHKRGRRDVARRIRRFVREKLQS